MNASVKRQNICFTFFIIIVLALFLISANNAAAQPLKKVMEKASKKEEVKKEPKKEEKAPTPEAIVALGPPDKYDRGVPRTSVEGFLDAAGKGDYKRAAEYLDLRNLQSRGIDERDGPRLAQKLKIILERALWIDLDLLSTEPDGYANDNLPSYRDLVGRIKTPQKTVDILLQQVPREDGVRIWKFSNRTVAEIPFLYTHFGYSQFEEKLSKYFPDITLLGLKIWQLIMLTLYFGFGFLIALIPTQIASRIIQKRKTPLSIQISRFIARPICFLVAVLLCRTWKYFIVPSPQVQAIYEAGTLLIIAVTWVLVGLANIFMVILGNYFERSEQKAAAKLLGPVNNIVKVVIILVAFLFWLDNLGFKMTTVLAGLGVGGIAVALAAQDTIKNFFGTIVILLDRPFTVGQRIVVEGNDGIVEDIGLRSTKIRLFTGHLISFPNETMARVNIENIGRRPYIRRLTHIKIPYDTPLEKVEKAVEIIRNILKDHEGIDQSRPPRVHFNEFNDASLNIIMLYWYHPPRYWDFLAFNERINKQIMQEFEKEGIKFALPASTTFLAEDKSRPLHLGGKKDSEK